MSARRLAGWGFFWRRPVVIAVAAAMLILVMGCGQVSDQLVSTAQVQKAFARAGLQTKIVFDCFAERNSLTITSVCPAEAVAIAQSAPHVVGMVADQHTISKSNIGSPVQAWVLDSTHAADGFNRLTTVGSSGETVQSELRLQVRNVVVISARRHGDYARKAQAALAALR
jgi:hypothetical protein